MSTRRWALSPLDHHVHLLDQPGGLTARCGHLLLTDVHQLDQPPPGPPCESCRQIFIADFAITPRSPHLIMMTLSWVAGGCIFVPLHRCI